MKPTSIMMVTLVSAFALPGHAEYFEDRYRRLTASPKVLTIQVVDEDGRPLAGARGDSISYNPNNGRHGGEDLVADERGILICKDPPNYFTTDMRLNLSQADAIAGWKSYDVCITQQDYLRFEEPKLSLKLTLPYVRNPIPLKAKSELFTHYWFKKRKDTEPDDPRQPDLAITEVGYDAELLELMPPLGEGKHLDFTITVTSVFRGFLDAWTERSAVVDVNRGLNTFDEGKVSYGDWTHTVTYRFPNKGDGISLSPQFWPYCKLTIPQKAPETGYAQELTLRELRDYHASRPNFSNYRERLANNGMYLRVRTQLDKDGNVVSANYAKIISPLGAGNRFLIFYNPTPNDRNLEYDRMTNLRWQELHPLSKEPPTVNSPYDVISN